MAENSNAAVGDRVLAVRALEERRELATLPRIQLLLNPSHPYQLSATVLSALMAMPNRSSLPYIYVYRKGLNGTPSGKLNTSINAAIDACENSD